MSRKLIAWAFAYSVDDLLADDGTEYREFCLAWSARSGQEVVCTSDAGTTSRSGSQF
jgi:hypothetical protein